MEAPLDIYRYLSQLWNRSDADTTEPVFVQVFSIHQIEPFYGFLATVFCKTLTPLHDWV